jgi:hypothetical protein
MGKFMVFLITVLAVWAQACGNPQSRALSDILDANQTYLEQLQTLVGRVSAATNRSQFEAAEQAYLEMANAMDGTSRSIMKRHPASVLDAIVKGDAYKKATEASGHVLGEWTRALGEARKRCLVTVTNTPATNR